MDGTPLGWSMGMVDRLSTAGVSVVFWAIFLWVLAVMGCPDHRDSGSDLIPRSAQRRAVVFC